MINKKSKQVINNTVNIENIWAKELIKLPEVILDETITEVIAAGPANRGIAKGNIEVDIIFPSIDFSLRADLLSRSISIEINNRIIPPAILKEYNEIFKWFKIILPITKKNTSTKNANKVASIAILFLFSLILCNNVRKIATVPKGSITTK